ncbi:MAG: helix-turn-helix transcriptional regulator [Clostridia bacterium]|nr:helix-turn-helix transcriptional regulator [Clostridia bacterium]
MSEFVIKLPERLKELMFDKGVTAIKLASALDINSNYVTRYLQGNHLPTYSIFVKIIEYFNCSADFLLGLTEFPHYETVYLPVKAFSINFKKAIGASKLSQYAIQKKTGISWASFHFWLKGDRQPYVDSLVKLADFLEVSVDYLLGRVD